MDCVKAIGSRLELFVDDWLIDEMKHVRLKLHSPVKREEVLAGENFGYGTVFQDDGHYRMYYRSGGDLVDWTKLPEKDRKNQTELTAYAESEDGVNWTRPELGIIEYNGSSANHFIWDAEGARKDTTHNFTPFKDANPAAPAETRYKALAGKKSGGGLRAFASPDGIHWQKIREEPVITDEAFDSQNLAFWDEQREQYVAFVREFIRVPVSAEALHGGIRSIKRCTSQDFLNWSKPQWVDLGDTPDEHLYTNAVTPYFRAPHIYLSFPRRFVEHRKKLDGSMINGISDQVFMTSRDGGVKWDRRFMEAFVRQGPDPRDWSDRSGTIHWGVVPTGDHEISLYWCERQKHPTQCISRGTLRTDGFASVHADYEGGEFTTKPLRFDGDRLILNYATSAVGSVQVELQDLAGNPVEGFELTEPLYGDEIEGKVVWSAGEDVSRFIDQPVRLRFVMKDADIYALRFQQST